MYVCVCVFRFEVPLCIVISVVLCRASGIFRYLKLLRTRNACHANPERERRERERERRERERERRESLVEL